VGTTAAGSDRDRPESRALSFAGADLTKLARKPDLATAQCIAGSASRRPTQSSVFAWTWVTVVLGLRHSAVFASCSKFAQWTAAMYSRSIWFHDVITLFEIGTFVTIARQLALHTFGAWWRFFLLTARTDPILRTLASPSFDTRELCVLDAFSVIFTDSTPVDLNRLGGLTESTLESTLAETLPRSLIWVVAEAQPFVLARVRMAASLRVGFIIVRPVLT